MSIEICEKYFDIGIELGLASEVLINDLETGDVKTMQGKMKAVRMLLLWQQSVAEEDFTYSKLAAALENHGFQRCAHKYCYTSSISTGNHTNIL